VIPKRGLPTAFTFVIDGLLLLVALPLNGLIAGG